MRLGFLVDAFQNVLFQSTHPHGVRLRLNNRTKIRNKFQSTHPHGVRPVRQKGRHTSVCFNPRTRMGCDTQSFQRLIQGQFCFNPRTRMGCDKRERASIIERFSFNPRTRMGCDQGKRHTTARAFVSIHAPAWGATIHFVSLNPVGEFQSTHPHGVRRSRVRLIHLNLSFNPRTRMGCDPDYSWSASFPSSVSIHAPAWGATLWGRNWLLGQKFQSTHPHGVRPSEIDVDFDHELFQSTHPHGVRLLISPRYESSLKFQSTHPHGVRRCHAAA